MNPKFRSKITFFIFIFFITLPYKYSLALQETISLASYNILANSYIKKEYYPNSNVEFLKWDNRKDYLIKYIKNFNTDIICLQEFEEKEMYDFFEKELSKIGYQLIFQPENTESQIGVATLYKKDKISNVSIEKIKLINGNKVALITKFKTFSGKELTVINTKIKWAPIQEQKKEYIGFQQMEDLLTKKLNNIIKQIIICGDMNAYQFSSVYKLFINKGLVDTFKKNSYNTVNANFKAKRVDYCFISKDLNYIAYGMNGLKDDTIVPSPQIPSDHLPLILKIML